MNSKCFLLVLAFCLLHDCVATKRDISESNAIPSIGCFNIYVPALKQETDLFESQYLSCFKNAANKRRFADENTICQRRQLEEAVATNCVNRCQNINDTVIAIFNCYEAEGISIAKQMYQLSANAVEYRQDLRIQYATIEGEQNKCTDKAERGYVENSIYLYEALLKCLNSNGATLTSSTTKAAYQSR